MLKVKNSYSNYFANIRKKGDFGRLTSREFSTFLKKFCGTLVYKGKKSYSIKTYNYLLNNLKLRFKKDPITLIHAVAKKLMPIFVVGQKHYRGSSVDVPVLARGNKKNLYMLNWLVRQLRNKSNIIGVKKQDILKILSDSYKSTRSEALNSKRQHDEVLQNVKHNLKRMTSNRKLLNKWRINTRIQQKKENEIAQLNLTAREEVHFKEDENNYNFLRSIYLNLIRKKMFNKYERKVYRKRVLRYTYSAIFKREKRQLKARAKRKLKKLKHGKRNKKRV